jgi:GrpB-like predicted nucleotidyltransferase (UPF0157 family)
MKSLADPPAGYYNRFKTKPVTVRPFDPATRLIAGRYAALLEQLLPGTEIVQRGSTVWGLAGKGDIELGIYAAADAWESVLTTLTRRYGPAPCVEQNYARFNDSAEGHEIEIILLRGYEAEVDRALHAYLPEHPELLAEYEHIKRTYAYSRREYQRQKDRFFTRVIAMIPDSET